MLYRSGCYTHILLHSPALSVQLICQAMPDALKSFQRESYHIRQKRNKTAHMPIISGWPVKFNYQATNERASIQLNSYIVYDLPHFGPHIHKSQSLWRKKTIIQLEKNVFGWEIGRKSSNANNNSINISEIYGERETKRNRTKREMIRVHI